MKNYKSREEVKSSLKLLKGGLIDFPKKKVVQTDNKTEAQLFLEWCAELASEGNQECWTTLELYAFFVGKVLVSDENT